MGHNGLKMNTEEAKAVLDNELERFRTMSHEDLVRTVGAEPYTADQIGPSGKIYQIKIRTKLKNRKKKTVRIIARAIEISPKHVVWRIPIIRLPLTFCTGGGIGMSFTRGPEESLN